MRGAHDRSPEYELIDTGVFNDDRYFDVFVEYAKSSPEECFVRITVANRGPETATIHLLPTLWFRNTWSWWPGPAKPHLSAAKRTGSTSVVAASHPELGDRWLYCDGAPPLLFTENETNTERFFGTPNATPYVKDAFHAFVVHGENRRRQSGRKSAPRPQPTTSSRSLPGKSVEVRLCLTDAPQSEPSIRGLREDVRGQASRGGRVLPIPHARVRRRRHARRSCARPSPASSGRSSTTSSTSTCGSASTACDPLDSPSSVPVRNRALVPHVQRRRHLDAGQVGIPVVCGLGSRVSRGRADGRRSRLCETSAQS